jgi:pimeloyl-ACP methyl ester carboxylesterase
VRHPLPVILVHGGGGQMVHYMGLGGMSGWAHHFIQAGYKVYLVDRVGPCVLMTHSAGGPFGWLVANEKPNLVKAVVSFEGATAPLVGPGGAAGTPLPNLKGMPIMYLLSERGGRPGKPILDALLQSGARAEVIDLKERGILGNSHFAMFENNRRQVFDVIKGWIDQHVPGGTSSSTARL